MKSGTIQPSAALNALLEGKEGIRKMLEENADSQVIHVLNLWAEMDPQTREAAAALAESTAAGASPSSL